VTTHFSLGKIILETHHVFPIHWMQEVIFFSKKSWKYCDGISKYFIKFSQEKLQENKTYYPNISV
jgi:hypothetical protein